MITGLAFYLLVLVTLEVPLKDSEHVKTNNVILAPILTSSLAKADVAAWKNPIRNVSIGRIIASGLIY